MQTRLIATCALLSMVALTACGDDASGESTGAGGSAATGTSSATGPGATGSTSGATGPGSGGGDAGAGGSGGGGTGEVVTLVSAEWSLEPGTEIYQCTRITLEEDLWITEFQPVIPLGTHHTVVSLAGSGGEPDGTRECTGPFEGSQRQIYGTGVGAEALSMPPGVATKIAAGEQVILNLHLFNTGTETLSGTSGIDVLVTTEAEVEIEADLEIWGKVDLSIPPNDTSVHTTSCVMQSDLTLFAVQPHMHVLGRHLTFTHTPAGGSEVVLFDEDYDFDSQVHATMDPMVELAAGDTVTITCTYDNATSDTVFFGESTGDEMCFAGLFVYPANLPFCPLF